MFIGYLISTLVKLLLKSYAHFKNRLPLIGTHIFHVLDCVRYMIYGYFLPFCDLSTGVFWRADVFNYDEIQFIDFFPCYLSFCKKFFPNSGSEKTTPMIF